MITTSTLDDSPTSSATSGKLFKGEQKHTFDRSKLLFNKYMHPNGETTKPEYADEDSSIVCEHWSVVTTIFEPSDAIIKQSNLNGWCICVVGDKKTPDEEYAELGKQKNVVVLTSEMQETLAYDFPLSSALTWNHFGRKNFGFMYAIHHGAKVIWDFDDDNILLANKHIYLLPRELIPPKKVVPDDPVLAHKYTGFTYVGFEPTRTSSLNTPEARRKLTEAKSIWPTTCGLVVNPYPLMGATNSPCWPRGFPLECIQFNEIEFAVTNGKHATKFNSSTIGVLQSLANHDPDVDAIYRLTQPLPFDFPLAINTHHKEENSNLPLVVPKGVYSPYNAQATLHMENALWSLLLPITVHGRISDIWRGYITTRLGQDIGMRLAFTPPMVAQFRNAHSYLADFDSELPLYQQSLKLVEQLSAWKPSTACARSLPARMEELWVFLYEHDYIQMDDVLLLQKWIQSLIKFGYDFPPIIEG